MINGVHHIALRALDFDASMKFYTEGLGLKVRTTWQSGANRAAMIELGGGSCIELFEGGVGEKTEPAMQAGEWFHLALRTDDTDAVYQAALAAGATSKMEPKSAQIGDMPIRIAFVYGPSNEVIEFFKEG